MSTILRWHAGEPLSIDWADETGCEQLGDGFAQTEAA
jgi:hypothetical protein